MGKIEMIDQRSLFVDQWSILIDELLFSKKKIDGKTRKQTQSTVHHYPVAAHIVQAQG